jgi:hypothetical protein
MRECIVQIIIFHWSEGGERSGPTGAFSGRRWGFIPHSGRSEGFKPYRRSKRRDPPFFDVVAFGSNIPEYGQQRVFNDLQRAGSSRDRMIWLLAHLLSRQ